MGARAAQRREIGLGFERLAQRAEPLAKSRLVHLVAAKVGKARRRAGLRDQPIGSEGAGELFEYRGIDSFEIGAGIVVVAGCHRLRPTA